MIPADCGPATDGIEKDRVKISKPTIAVEENTVVYRTEIESEDGRRDLWFRLDAKYADLVTDSCDPALVGLLIPAMAAGEDIHLSGPISERLYYNLSGPCQNVFGTTIPILDTIDIHPAGLRSKSGRPPGVATGFTGGIDSFCVLADHHYSPDCPEGFRLTHLVFNNVGSHGHGSEGERIFKSRYARLAPFVERIGLPFVALDSNLDSFYSERLGFAQTHTPRIIAAALLLQGGIGRYLSASSTDYRAAAIYPCKYISSTESICIPLLASESLDVLSVGHQYRRVDKTLKVADIPDSYEILDVCMREGDRNCTTCRKCLRTMITLDIAGLLDNYPERFDLAQYRARENELLSRFFRKKTGRGKLRGEVIALAKETGWRMPLPARLRTWLYKIGYPIRRLQRPLKSKAKKMLWKDN